MSNFQIKLIALITMTIDHIGYILIPATSVYYEPLRTIGRLSFILFAFLITEGLSKTKNQNRYMATLFAFAFVMDIPRLFFDLQYFPNVFYTLGMGALAVYLIKHFDNVILQIVSVLAMMYFATALNVDYGAFGIMVIVVIEVAKMITNDIKILREVVMASGYFLLMTLFEQPSIQMFGIYSFLIIMLYNGQRGFYHPKLKYLIYVYYPLHLVVLYGISLVL
ncbi:TraX family protein [Mollicutes bacterium LVI A0039]|nr:TraX family protein [Mollicutes bacterium LVI A0039]